MTPKLSRIAALLGDAPEKTEARHNPRPLIGLIVVLAVIGFGIGEWVISSRAKAIVGTARHRAEVILANRAETAEGWLGRWRDATAPLRDNPTIQIFARETTRGGGTGAQAADLVSYLQMVMDDFFRQRPEVLASHLVDARGRAFLASSHAGALAEEERAQARAVFPTGKERIDPLRVRDGRLVYDVYLPLRAAQAAGKEDVDRSVAVLILTIDAEGALAEILEPGRTLETGEHIALLQGREGALVAALRDGKTLVPVAAETLAAAGRFEPAQAPGLKDAAYLLAEAVPGTPWRVLYARNAAEVRGDIVATRIVVTLLVVAVLVCVGAGIVLLWWRQSLQASRQLADQYRDFAERLDVQHRLLTSINDAIAEHIYVIDQDRRVVYANTPFAALSGRPVAECVGEGIDTLLPSGLAGHFARWDSKILGGSPAEGSIVEDADGPESRWISVSKVPFSSAGGETTGVVTVCRDVTRMQQERLRQQRLMRNTIRVLTSSVAAADPYLANHAGRMADIAAAVARTLGCDRDEVATLETACALSQVGKIFLPRELVRKEARLSGAELKEMERHIELALEAIKGIEFDLPVPETLAQMHERLDGTGYPLGLSGERMTLAGRILGVADVYAARTEPRSYRRAASPQVILGVLHENAEKYDSRVVDALEQVLRERGDLPSEPS